MKTTIAGGLGIAVVAMASSVAQADDHASDNSYGTLTGNLGVATEYVFRGVPSSGNTAQVSASVDWTRNNVYVGTWLSNVANDNTGNEVYVYAGITAGDFDFGALAYIYPADTDDTTSADNGAGGVRNSKDLEIYAGYNHGIFSGYAWYGVGSYGRSDDDYVYLEGNITVPTGENAELGMHVGYTIYHGDDFNRGVASNATTGAGYRDQQVDLGLTLSIGGLWFGMTSVLENDTNGGSLERPRINAGYNWTFDNLMPVRLRF